MPAERQEIRSLDAPGVQVRMPGAPDPIGDAMQQLLSQAANTVGTAEAIQDRQRAEQLRTDEQTDARSYLQSKAQGKPIPEMLTQRGHDMAFSDAAQMKAATLDYGALLDGRQDGEQLDALVMRNLDDMAYNQPDIFRATLRERILEGVSAENNRRQAIAQRSAVDDTLQQRKAVLTTGTIDDQAIADMDFAQGVAKKFGMSDDNFLKTTIGAAIRDAAQGGDVERVTKLQSLLLDKYKRPDLAVGMEDIARKQHDIIQSEVNLPPLLDSVDAGGSANDAMYQADKLITDPVLNNSAKTQIQARANQAWENRYFAAADAGAPQATLDAILQEGYESGAVTAKQKVTYEASATRRTVHQDKVAFVVSQASAPNGAKVGNDYQDAGIDIGVQSGFFAGEAVGTDGQQRFDGFPEGREKDAVAFLEATFDKLPSKVIDRFTMDAGGDVDTVRKSVREFGALTPDMQEEVLHDAKGIAGVRLMRVKYDAKDGVATDVDKLMRLAPVEMTKEEIAQSIYNHNANTAQFSSAALHNMRTTSIGDAIPAELKARNWRFAFKPVDVPFAVVDEFGESQEDRYVLCISAGIPKAQAQKLSIEGAARDTFNANPPMVWRGKTIFVRGAPTITPEVSKALESHLAGSVGKNESLKSLQDTYRPVWDDEKGWAYADVTGLSGNLYLVSDKKVVSPQADALQRLSNVKMLDRPMAQYMAEKGVPRFSGDWSKDGQMQAVREMIFRYKQLGENPQTICTDPRYNAPNGWSPEASALLRSSFPQPDKATK